MIALQKTRRQRTPLRGVFGVEPVRDLGGKRIGTEVRDASGATIGTVGRAPRDRWELSAGVKEWEARDWTIEPSIVVLRRQTQAAALAALLRYLRGNGVMA